MQETLPEKETVIIYGLGLLLSRDSMQETLPEKETVIIYGLGFHSILVTIPVNIRETIPVTIPVIMQVYLPELD